MTTPKQSEFENDLSAQIKHHYETYFPKGTRADIDFAGDQIGRWARQYTLDEVKEEMIELKRDKERFEWMCKAWNKMAVSGELFFPFGFYSKPRDAIDAAMKENK